MNKLRYNEPDFPDFLRDLIVSERLEEKEIGIIKYYFDHGYEALSENQKYVFNHTIEENTVEECTRCAIDIPWCEMLEALDNGGYCNYCQHMMEKEEDDDDEPVLCVSGTTINIVNKECINDPNIIKQHTEDSSIRLNYTFLGITHSNTISHDEIDTAYLSSITHK